MYARYQIKYIHFKLIICWLAGRLVDSSSRFARVRINFDLISKSHTKKPKNHYFYYIFHLFTLHSIDSGILI